MRRMLERYLITFMKALGLLLLASRWGMLTERFTAHHERMILVDGEHPVNHVKGLIRFREEDSYCKDPIDR